MVRDSELVGASLAGSPVAFAVLVTRHRERARRVAARLLGDAHEAEDVAQEALLQAYVGLGALRERDRFGSWLAGIAANLARGRLRGRGRRAALLDEQDGVDARDATEQAGLLARVQAAIEALPRAERAAVLACDVLGLSREEAASFLECSPGAVRVRLHRARGRLRAELRDYVPVTMPPKEEREMIELEIRDVVTRFVANGKGAEAPPSLEGARQVVLLAEKGGERVLPIWIGPPEAGALVLGLAGEELPRPMSADLMARLVEALGGKVERVVISSLRDETFFASIALTGGSGRVQVDARPSDALNLAHRLGAPIFVEEGVLDQAGVPADGLEERLGREEARMADGPREGTWRSVTPQVVRGWWRLHVPTLAEPEEE